MSRKRKTRWKTDPITGLKYEKGSLLDLMKHPQKGSMMDMLSSIELGVPKRRERKTRKLIGRGLLKKLMVRSQGNCENCGKSLMNVKIHIHHKNSDPTDDRESNLMVVCRNCHKKLTGPPPKKRTQREGLFW